MNVKTGKCYCKVRMPILMLMSNVLFYYIFFIYYAMLCSSCSIIPRLDYTHNKVVRRCVWLSRKDGSKKMMLLSLTYALDTNVNSVADLSFLSQFLSPCHSLLKDSP